MTMNIKAGHGATIIRMLLGTGSEAAIATYFQVVETHESVNRRTDELTG